VEVSAAHSSCATSSCGHHQQQSVEQQSLVEQQLTSTAPTNLEPHVAPNAAGYAAGGAGSPAAATAAAAAATTAAAAHALSFAALEATNIHINSSIARYYTYLSIYSSMMRSSTLLHKALHTAANAPGCLLLPRSTSLLPPPCPLPRDYGQPPVVQAASDNPVVLRVAWTVLSLNCCRPCVCFARPLLGCHFAVPSLSSSAACLCQVCVPMPCCKHERLYSLHCMQRTKVQPTEQNMFEAAAVCSISISV